MIRHQVQAPSTPRAQDQVTANYWIIARVIEKAHFGLNIFEKLYLLPQSIVI
jgi:hypothetical protein